MLAFQLAAVAVTCWPLCVVTALHELEICWLPVKAQRSVQPLIGAEPRFVTVRLATKPEPQSLTAQPTVQPAEGSADGLDEGDAEDDADRDGEAEAEADRDGDTDTDGEADAERDGDPEAVGDTDGVPPLLATIRAEWALK